MAKDKILKPFVGIIAPENKFTVDTIDDLKSRNYLTIGDTVDLNGYYTAGDGAHHKRKIESADDGSGVQLANGLWANIVHNGEMNVSWLGVENENIENHIEWCLNNSINLIIDKTIEIKRPILITAFKPTFNIKGKNFSTIRAVTEMEYMFYTDFKTTDLYNLHNCNIEDLTFDLNFKCEKGLHLAMNSSTIARCVFRNGGIGIYVESAQLCTFDSLTFYKPKTALVFNAETDSNYLKNINVSYNTDYALIIRAGLDYMIDGLMIAPDTNGKFVYIRDTHDPNHAVYNPPRNITINHAYFEGAANVDNASFYVRDSQNVILNRPWINTVGSVGNLFSLEIGGNVSGFKFYHGSDIPNRTIGKIKIGILLNLKKWDLNPIEFHVGYKLSNVFEFQDATSKQVNIYVANMLGKIVPRNLVAPLFDPVFNKERSVGEVFIKDESMFITLDGTTGAGISMNKSFTHTEKIGYLQFYFYKTGGLVNGVIKGESPEDLEQTYIINTKIDISPNEFSGDVVLYEDANNLIEARADNVIYMKLKANSKIFKGTTFSYRNGKDEVKPMESFE